MDEAQQDALLSSRMSLYSHPGGTILSNIYPNSSNTTKSLAPSVTSSGRQRIEPSTKGYGALSTFNLSSSDIIQGLTLNLSVTVKPNASDGTPRFALSPLWPFQLIEYTEWIYPSSYTSNQRLSGSALFNAIMLSCRSKEERDELIARITPPPAGVIQNTTAATTLTASIPIGYFFLTNSGLGGSFPLDYSTIPGSVQLNVSFKSVESLVSVLIGGATVTASTGTFPTCFLTCRATQLSLASTSIKSKLAMDPNVAYNISSQYITSQVFPLTLDTSNDWTTTVNLTGAPNAILNYILLDLRPTIAGTGGGVLADLKRRTPVSDLIAGIHLTYDSQTLFQCASLEEYRAYMATCFRGDDLRFDYLSSSAAVDGAVVGNANADVKALGQLFCIPMTYDGAEVRTHELRENLPSYGSATLQLTLSGPAYKTYQTVAAGAYQSITGSSLRLANTAFTLQVHYVCASTFSVSSGGIEILL